MYIYAHRNPFPTKEGNRRPKRKERIFKVSAAMPILVFSGEVSRRVYIYICYIIHFVLKQTT